MLENKCQRLGQGVAGSWVVLARLDVHRSCPVRLGGWRAKVDERYAIAAILTV
jgi:hypothetical protein